MTRSIQFFGAALLRHLLVLTCLLANAQAAVPAGDAVPVAQIEKVVTTFAGTQGCMVTFDRKNIVPLEFEGERSFVVLYSLDIGCSGGSGSTRPAVAVLSRDYRGDVLIRPQFSSPTQTSQSLPRQIQHIYLKEGRLWFSAKEFDPRKDALCCPSIPVEAPLVFKGDQWRDGR
jgi:hypothetical protein